MSLAVSQVYADRFDLTRAEWRVLAALGANGRMAAKDVAPYSTLDKMQVEPRGRAPRAGRTRNARRGRARPAHENPTPDGGGKGALPEARAARAAREDYILGAWRRRDRAALDRIMDAVLQRAEGLIRRG